MFLQLTSEPFWDQERWQKGYMCTLYNFSSDFLGIFFKGIVKELNKKYRIGGFTSTNVFSQCGTHTDTISCYASSEN